MILTTDIKNIIKTIQDLNNVNVSFKKLYIYIKYISFIFYPIIFRNVSFQVFNFRRPPPPGGNLESHPDKSGKKKKSVFLVISNGIRFR